MSDRTNKRYYFEFTACRMPNVVRMDLAKLELGEGGPVLMFDMASDLEASVEVWGKFRPADPVALLKAGGTVMWRPARRSR